MPETIEVRLDNPSFLLFKSKVQCRVLIDNDEVGTLRMGETADFPVTAGEHELAVAMDVGPITRQAKPVRVIVREGATARVLGTYSRLWGKYTLSLPDRGD